jgi:hypothetical protein
VIVGGDVFVGATEVDVEDWTTADEALSAHPEPAEFVAVTPTRIVCPTSAEVSDHVWLLVVETTTQFAPAESQRRQKYENVIGVEPLHVPDELTLCV